MKEKIEKAKNHLKENKKLYIATGATAIGGIVVGATSILVLRKDVVQTVKVVQGIAWKSPVTQNVIQQAIPRAGHAGKVLVDRDDPTKFYMSVRLLADALNISPKKVRRYLAGEIPDLAGRQYDVMIDGAPPLVAQMTVKA